MAVSPSKIPLLAGRFGSGIPPIETSSMGHTMKHLLTRNGSLLLALTFWSLTTPLFAANALKNTVTGTPKIGAIEVISFGPEGILLIGDGRLGQLVAVDTGDVTPLTWTVKGIEKIDEQLAGRLGTTAKGIEILHVAVNPASHRAYVLVRKQDDKKTLILTIDGTGKINEFALEKVKYAAIALPASEKAPVRRVTDIAWAGDRVLVGAVTNEEFASKVFSLPVPLDPMSKNAGFSTETYHVSHRKWETRAPMTALMAHEEKGKKYVVGAFACTPVVRYDLEDIKPEGKVKGESVVELGSGNQPLQMFRYEKDGKAYVLVNNFRFHHAQRPFGPSPYITFRMDLGVLSEPNEINEKALLRLKGNQPGTDKIKLIEEYHGVKFMDRLDKDRALVIKQDEKTGLSLGLLPLP